MVVKVKPLLNNVERRSMRSLADVPLLRYVDRLVLPSTTLGGVIRLRLWQSIGVLTRN
jgi:hypothetical protein